MPEIRTEVMTVNMEPQHPSTHGVLRLVLELDGETVLSAAPTIQLYGRGVWWILEDLTALQHRFGQIPGFHVAHAAEKIAIASALIW